MSEGFGGAVLVSHPYMSNIHSTIVYPLSPGNIVIVGGWIWWEWMWTCGIAGVCEGVCAGDGLLLLVEVWQPWPTIVYNIRKGEECDTVRRVIDMWYRIGVVKVLFWERGEENYYWIK